MNPYWLLITNLKYLCKIMIHQNPRACWNHYIRVHLWSKFIWLVGFGGSIFFKNIWDLWSVTNTDSCIKGPQDSEKMLVTYWTSSWGCRDFASFYLAIRREIAIKIPYQMVQFEDNWTIFQFSRQQMSHTHRFNERSNTEDSRRSCNCNLILTLSNWVWVMTIK